MVNLSSSPTQQQRIIGVTLHNNGGRMRRRCAGLNTKYAVVSLVLSLVVVYGTLVYQYVKISSASINHGDNGTIRLPSKQISILNSKPRHSVNDINTDQQHQLPVNHRWAHGLVEPGVVQSTTADTVSSLSSTTADNLWDRSNVIPQWMKGKGAR